MAGSSALAVCQRLMHFFRQHLLYETFDVLEPLWRSLDAVLASPDADLDQARPVSACCARLCLQTMLALLPHRELTCRVQCQCWPGQMPERDAVQG